MSKTGSVTANTHRQVKREVVILKGEIALLKELCHRAYTDSDIRLKDGWIADYKRLVEDNQ